MSTGIHPLFLDPTRRLAPPTAESWRPTRTAAENRCPGFLNGLLWQIVLCSALVAGLLGAGKLAWSGRCFWIVFGLVLVRLIVMRQPAELLCLLIGTAPLSNLLRETAFYNVVVVLFGAGLMFYFFHAPGTVRTVMRRAPLAIALLVYATIYYSLSLWFTGSYSTNLRLFDLGFAVVALLLMGRNRRLLGTALLGMMIASCAVGLGMLPYNDTVGRLGMVRIDGYTLGNPAELGLSLALAFLALTVDRGHWVNLDHKPVIRFLLLVPVVTLLALTTSRVGWLVAVTGLVVALLFRSRARFGILIAIALAFVAIRLVLLSPFGSAVQTGLDRTFSSERSVANRTSGRSDQWLVASTAFTDSMSSLMFGHGPGRGADAYAHYSTAVEGVRYGVGERRALHSLFMQVMVEAGLLGLLPLIVWLLCATWRILQWMLATRWIFPLVCFLGYGLIVLTVSGNDTASGTYMGIGLLATLQPIRSNKTEPGDHAQR